MFQSKTVRTLLVMFLVNVVSVYGVQLDPTLLTIINLGLSSLATYWKINTDKVYTPTDITPPASGSAMTLGQP